MFLQSAAGSIDVVAPFTLDRGYTDASIGAATHDCLKGTTFTPNHRIAWKLTLTFSTATADSLET